MVKFPASKLGKVSLLLIVFTFAAWLFVNNANNCLSRDFVDKAPPAVCWRAANDYESTIEQSQIVYLVLLALAIICSSATISMKQIKHSRTSAAEYRKTAWFLAILSGLLLTFIVTLFTVWQQTTFNNNNYAFNTATDVVVKLGVPIWLAITTSAITYGLNSFKFKHTI